jgi:hypothetical protein
VKYSALRTISVIFKVLAVLAAVGAIIGALISLGSGASYSAFGGVVGAIIALLYGALICLYLFAASEFILVFLDIEENTRQTEDNTRQTADLLRNYLNRQA